MTTRNIIIIVFITTLTIMNCSGCVPKVVDYSKYVTLIRNQDGWGGCGGMATLHVFDIQMERLAPYTPDGSYAFNSYVFNDSKGNHTTRDPRILIHDLDQTGVLKNYGSCPESTYHTNYDGMVGDIEPVPPDIAFQHAKKYTVIENKKELPKTIEELKKLLYEKGPLVFNHTPEGSSAGHVVALIGYNDNTQMIKYINSANFADGYGGIQERSYDYFLGRLQDLSGDQGIYWMKVTHVDPDKYTARVNISHLLGRKFLSVRIGVEGKEALTVWDKNCSINMLDDTKNLVIDVARPPEYVQSYWPPRKGNFWYVEVVDSSPGSGTTTGYLEDVALVDRQFHGVSKYTITLTSPSSTYFPITGGETLKVYIPSRKTLNIDLSIDHSSISPGDTVTLKGKVWGQIILSNKQQSSGPQKDQNIEINEIINDPIEGVVTSKLIGSAVTDSQGNYTISYKPTATAQYRASVVEQDRSVIAVSNAVSCQI